MIVHQQFVSELGKVDYETLDTIITSFDLSQGGLIIILEIQFLVLI